MKLFGLTNVSIEDKSDYRFEELNESRFIKNVIEELKGLLLVQMTHHQSM